MLEPVFEFIRESWDLITPLYVINDYEEGVLLRFGRYKKTVTPGLHFKIPVVDDILSAVTKPTTMCLKPQSLFTRDNMSVVVQGVCKYCIPDVKTYLIDVSDGEDGIANLCQRAIKQIIGATTWLDVDTVQLDNDIAKKARVEARKWGADIEFVTLITIDKIISLRLILDSKTEEI
jgi:regulator of protease activity HflC (stomatin/prohibitin superfamily)